MNGWYNDLPIYCYLYNMFRRYPQAVKDDKASTIMSESVYSKIVNLGADISRDYETLTETFSMIKPINSDLQTNKYKL